MGVKIEVHPVETSAKTIAASVTTLGRFVVRAELDMAASLPVEFILFVCDVATSPRILTG